MPWLLVASSVILALLLAYTLFGGYLPAKRRVASLERELRDLYGREAELRLEEAERQLAAARGQRR
jgi:hypothetical protein